MGQAYNGLGLYPAAHSLLLEAVTAASRSGPSPELLRAQLALAANRYVEADYKEAEVRYRHALTLARQLHGDNDPTVSEALTGLGDSLFDLDRAPEAETLYRQALDIDLRLHGEQHADTARTLSGLGSLLYLELRYSEAEPLMRRALAIRRAVFGERHAKVGESANNLATLLYDSGRLEEAATIYGQTLQVYRTIFGPDHPEVASLLNNVGRIDLMLGRLAPARVRIEEALAIDKKVRPAGHDDLIMPLNSLAMIDIEQGQFPAAQIQLKEALTTARARHHAMLYQVLATDADLSVRTGQTVQARAAMTESRAAFRELYGEQPAPSDTWRQAVLDSIEGSIATSEGRFDEAGRLLHAALPPLEARYGVDSLYPKQTRERLTTLDSRRKKP
jgi:tetratricopeptide (TPR) repeat protein